MKQLLIVFFIVILLLLILIFPFKSRFAGHFDLVKQKGFYALKIWRVKILNGMIWVENNKIEMKNSKSIISGGIDKSYAVEFTKKIISEFDIKKVEIYFTGGFQNDSFASAMMCGGAVSVVEAIYSVLSMNYLDVKLYEDIKPTFNDSNFEITINFVVSISILKIITSIIKAKMIENKKFKEIENEG